MTQNDEATYRIIKALDLIEISQITLDLTLTTGSTAKGDAAIAVIISETENFLENGMTERGALAVLRKSTQELRKHRGQLVS